MYFFPTVSRSALTADHNIETYFLPSLPLPPSLPRPTSVTQLTLSAHRNQKHLPSRRPFLHLPPILLHAPDRPCMGHRFQSIFRLHYPPYTPLRLRTLPRHIGIGGYSGVLPRGKATGAGNCRTARSAETAGAVHASRRGGDSGVWVLF